MRFTSATVLLASLVCSIHAGVVPKEADGILESRQEAQFIGTYDTFTDYHCSKGAEGVTVTTENDHGLLNQTIHSIRAYLPCRLAVWSDDGRGFYIFPGDIAAMLPRTALSWRAEWRQD
ncbi:hypothetical protein J3459_012156 [Metarhizium acridum]|nr:hypothetical protein J3459_012156 [Metarhizium acridum]